jgi:biotin carboxylase
VNASHKSRMRQALALQNVPQPQFAVISSIKEAEDVPMKLVFPLVVKPIDNMGGRGVKRIDNPAELVAAAEIALKFSKCGQAIVEEYIQGPEYSLDALVWAIALFLTGIVEKIKDVFFKGIRAIGITQGAAKGDIKLSSRGPLVGEIAARLSGGYMSGWTYPYSSGVNLTRAALKIAVGLPPGDLTPVEKAVSAERAFISIPGRVARIEGADDARTSPAVKAFFLRVIEDSNVVFPSNNVEKCGNVITKASDRAKAIKLAQDAIEKIFIRLAPDNDATEAFLSGKAFPNVRAYAIENPANREFLATMPDFYGDPAEINWRKPRVMMIPEIAEENSSDWHGIEMGRALVIIKQKANAEFHYEGKPGNALGKVFWSVFLRGGVQAAVYLLDTLARNRNTGAPAHGASAGRQSANGGSR